MSSADPPEPPPPPPPQARATDEPQAREFNWRRPQFSVATLLGLLTLVAVACVLAFRLPALGLMLAGLAAELVFAGYVGFLLAGVVLSSGHKRLFCIAAVATLVLSFLPGAGSAAVGQMAFRELGMSTGFAHFAWGLLGTVERIALSLFGGWVAVRAARYWQPSEAESSN